ncbi:MAG: phosphoglucosamine mutase [Candidatus Zixiibacteriota bacterium]
MLKRSISGVRGIVGDGLSPEVAARHAAAFGTVLKGKTVVIASDTRPTGPMIKEAAIAGLLSVGCNVVDIGIAPTPTVPLAVTKLKAAAGMAVTASHNPIEWNALKFLGSAKAVLPPATIERILKVADSGKLAFKRWDKIGRRFEETGMIEHHVRSILRLPSVDKRSIRRYRPRVVYDAGGGAGYEYAPALLDALGCDVRTINCKPGPRFPRGPEPVPKNLKQLGAAVCKAKADIGFATDPDSDRLAIVDERGKPLGEERTLILATYWVLSRTPGPVVVNLSTSRGVADVAAAHGQTCYTSKVGEANVAAMMRTKRAVIGGEGNGGVILPGLHPGRDALLGMALVLSLLANADDTISGISRALPTYHVAKVTRNQPGDFDDRLKRLQAKYIQEHQDDRDGVKVDFEDGSIHARPSNTEPIVRISAEARTQRRAKALLNDALSVLGL